MEVVGAGVASAMFLAPSSAIALSALCVAASGFIAVRPLFWDFPTGCFAGSAAAGGFALINALGALGGFVALNIKVWADRQIGSPSAGLYVLAGSALLAAGLIALLRDEQTSTSALHMYK